MIILYILIYIQHTKEIYIYISSVFDVTCYSHPIDDPFRGLPIFLEGQVNLADFPMSCRESHDEIGRVSRARTRYSGESLPVLVSCVMQPAERSLEKETELKEDVDANYGPGGCSLMGKCFLLQVRRLCVSRSFATTTTRPELRAQSKRTVSRLTLCGEIYASARSRCVTSTANAPSVAAWIAGIKVGFEKYAVWEQCNAAIDWASRAIRIANPLISC